MKIFYSIRRETVFMYAIYRTSRKKYGNSTFNSNFDYANVFCSSMMPQHHRASLLSSSGDKTLQNEHKTLS